MRKRIFEVIEIAESGDKLSAIYDTFMYVIIIISIIPLFFKQTYYIFHLIEIITVSIFIIDYILRWITADLKLKNRSLISYLKYPFTFLALLDLLSILPSLSILNQGFKILRIFRLNKAFRTLRLLRYSKSFNLIVSVMKKQQKPLLAVIYLALGYVVLTALIMFQVEPNSFDNFFDAVYWAVVTLTTVGYGDIYPVSDIGKVVGMLSSFMGIAIVALPTGIITAGYMSELNKEECPEE